MVGTMTDGRIYPAHILVVDDEPLVAEFATETLLHAGFVASFALRATGALEVVSDAPQLDLLLTDVVMPDMDGFKLAAISTALRPNLRVLYASGYGELSNQLIAAGESPINIVRKPYWQGDLVTAVRQALAA